ncbi:MAG: hypothetical protein ACFWTS_04055 [Pseudoclavibacter caeni]
MPAVSAFDLPTLARGLPAGAVLPGLAAAFARDAAPRLVVEAPPGSGKTTVVPPAIACHASGRVVVAEPRRLAARAAAARLASLTGTRVGDLAGYAVRGERRVSPAARVVFVTNGLLVRRLLADPELAGVSAVVIDEVHERGLDGDLAFALSDEVAQLRDDLTLAVMSATLDADRWAGLLGDDARVLRVPARPHPLRTVWAPPPDGVARLDDRGVTRAFLTHVAATIEHALAAHPEGSLLAFLPGRREVDAVVGLLRGRGIDARPLHGSMSSAEQDAALAEPPEGERRVIVATAIAESSLTVPGVHIVVDAGLAREPRLDRRRGFAGLVTVPASQASVAQRAGRAARLGPGVAVHCCAERELALAPAEARPEIATGDLTGLALALAAWGDPDAADLRLPDRPPAAALETARGTLAALGALARDDAGRVRITARGRALARVPAHPRLARALLDAAERIGPERAAELVAALDADLRAPGGDLAALLRELRRGGTPAARRWRRDVRRLARLVPGGPAGRQRRAEVTHRRTGSRRRRPAPRRRGARSRHRARSPRADRPPPRGLDRRVRARLGHRRGAPPRLGAVRGRVARRRRRRPGPHRQCVGGGDPGCRADRPGHCQDGGGRPAARRDGDRLARRPGARVAGAPARRAGARPHPDLPRSRGRPGSRARPAARRAA